MEFWKLFENWSVENYLKIGVVKIIWKLKFWRINLEIEVLKIRILKNWSFENDLKFEVLKSKSGNWSFENWNFE